MTDPSPNTDDAVVVSQRIRATPEQVFDYLVQPEKLVRWMGSEARLDARPGGEFWVNVTGDDVASGTFVDVDRPNRVVVSWGWEGSEHVPPGSSTVSFLLTADGDGTIVELIHSGLPGGQDDEHERGWNHYLPLLAAALGD